MNWPALLYAVSCVESGNDPRAVNQAEGAYGALQVRQCVIDDVNRHYGLDLRMVDVRTDTDTGRCVFVLYVRMWGAETPEQAARIWNGGPTGASKRATVDYWERIKAIMETVEPKERAGR